MAKQAPKGEVRLTQLVIAPFATETGSSYSTLVVTREGHTRRWREFLLQIGGTLDPVPGISRDYHARARAGRRIVETAVRPDGSVHVTYGNGSVTSYPPGSPGALRRAAAKREGEG